MENTAKADEAAENNVAGAAKKAAAEAAGKNATEAAKKVSAERSAAEAAHEQMHRPFAKSCFGRQLSKPVLTSTRYTLGSFGLFSVFYKALSTAEFEISLSVVSSTVSGDIRNVQRCCVEFS
ncbi:hypothetical protein L596_019401 [Steinernema carpocapsae]|uniref:Uncharacterized protein n=1 Tax=Steinernema carpocapsae TaxID=34508 RepID=A0A4U5MQL3_STECR|nr:hypothetical protein L596_019401 [Steinernema carpocapsae]